MPRYIEFYSEDESISARARLWDERAPKTCALVWDILPVSSYLQHAIYSGSELAMILPDYRPVDRENATVACLPWEIGYASLRGEDYFDVDSDFSELMFFYDRNMGPRMLDGLVAVNLFAQFETGVDELFQLARRIRLEGRKAFSVRRVES